MVKEPITGVIEIEAKKAGTINQKTFGTGSEGGTSDKWRVTGDAKQHLSIVSSTLFGLCFAGLICFLYLGYCGGQSNVVALGVVYTIFLQKL